MKRTFRHTLTVVLCCCILFAAFAPMVHAEDTLIKEAYATYTVPAANEAMDFNAITSPLGAPYTVKIVDVYYYDSATGSYAHIKSGDTVTAGLRYSVRIRFYAEKGYRFDDVSTVYTVNGEVEQTIVGVNIIETTFYPEKTAPDEPQPSKPTFRDRIASFMHDMRNRFLFVIFWLRNLFGIH